jgi:voltage-gated sodium channel
MAKYPNLEPHAAGVTSVAFHVSFVLLGTMIMLNLFIGVIMAGMQEAQDETDDLNRERAGKAPKLGDYSAMIAEMRELEEHVEALRHRVKNLRVRGEEGRR